MLFNQDPQARLAMGIEERRKKLMAAGPSWGDQHSTHVGGGLRVNPEHYWCNCEVSAEASTVTSKAPMIDAIYPPPAPVGRISTRGWTLESILATGERFLQVPRVAHQDATLAIAKFENSGVPLILEGLHQLPKWPGEEFRPEWLKEHGPKEISARNVHDWTDRTLPLDKFIEQSRSAPKFTTSGEEERLYGKDAECPEQWDQWLHQSKVIPPTLTPDDNPENLLSSRHVETLMCYLGIGDTFTPCHKDLCASSGQNLMCYTEKDGSSFWFMTKTSDAPAASKYLQKLNQELDHETHVISVEELANAPFEVYIAEQKLGDLVLVPPRSCHQVVNYGEHHRQHGSSIKKYEEGRELFFLAQKCGTKPDLDQQRVHLAEQYQTCKPINSKFMQAGWYDVHVQLISTIEEANSSQDMSMPWPLSPLTELDSPLPFDVPLPGDTETKVPVPSRTKRKRLVLDYVEVPRVGYMVQGIRAEQTDSTMVKADDRSGSSVQGANTATDMPRISSRAKSKVQRVRREDDVQNPPTKRSDMAPPKSKLPELPALTTSLGGMSSTSTQQRMVKPDHKKRRISSPSTAPIPHQGSSISRTRKDLSLTRAVPFMNPREYSPTANMSSEIMTETATETATVTVTSTSTSRSSRKDALVLSPARNGTMPQPKSGFARNDPLRSLPTIKKGPRFTKQPAPEAYSYQSSSSSSVYPRSTSSDASSLARATDQGNSQNHTSAPATINSDSPDVASTGNGFSQPVQPTNALGERIRELEDKVKRLETLPKPSAPGVPADFGTMVTSQHSQPMIAPPSPQNWTQVSDGLFRSEAILSLYKGNLAPMFMDQVCHMVVVSNKEYKQDILQQQQYPILPRSEWSDLGHHQSSPHYRDRSGYLAGDYFEDGPRLGSSGGYGRDDPCFENGPGSRSSTTYSHGRQDRYQDGYYSQPWNNRGHPYRYISRPQERTPPIGKSDNGFRRPYNAPEKRLYGNHPSRAKFNAGRRPNSRWDTRSKDISLITTTDMIQRRDQDNNAANRPTEQPFIPHPLLTPNSGQQTPTPLFFASATDSFPRGRSSSPRGLRQQSEPDKSKTSVTTTEDLDAESSEAIWEDGYEEPDAITEKVPHVNLSPPKQSDGSQHFASIAIGKSSSLYVASDD
ncbi:hypothetical protein H0H87_001965 [Tephrocybe sp. NHM501043]|nr:hypothetical protein H0H87_001965 [Tephrocybe sp. NHM501043]